MKYEVRFTSQFKRDLGRAKKQHKDLDKLYEIIEMLADGKVLDARYADHPLQGKYKGTRECHVERDWLLVYEIRKEVLVLVLYRLGTHAELFKK